MSEELKNVEVENALSTIFEKIGENDTKILNMDERFDTVDCVANTALNLARAAKDAVDNANFAPTNGFDVFLGVLGKVTTVAVVAVLSCAVVKCVQAHESNQPWSPKRKNNE